MITIDTEHGPASLWWDDQPGSDPGGWVLRYNTAHQEHLDEILDADDPDDPDAATAEALQRLAVRLRVGAGERLTAAPAAALAGVSPSTWRADVTRGRVPQPQRAARRPHTVVVDHHGHPRQGIDSRPRHPHRPDG